MLHEMSAIPMPHLVPRDNPQPPTLEERFATLEIKLELLMELEEQRSLKRKGEKEKEKAPPGYIKLTLFGRKYDFISSDGVRVIIRANESFFDGHVMPLGRNVYIKPSRVIEFFETGMCKSKRLNNLYKALRRYHPGLIKLVKELKDPAAAAAAAADVELRIEEE